MKIEITTDVTEPFEAKLLGKNPKTARAIWNLLPIHARARLWDDELYFKIPIKVKGENQQKRVNSGDIVYWPSGKEISIFLGSDREISVEDNLTVFGKIIGNSDLLKSGITKSGPMMVRIEKLEG